MDGSRDEGEYELFRNVLLLAGTEADVTKTAESLSQYEPGSVTAAYVISQSSGASNVVPQEKKRERADAIFDAVRETIPNANSEIINSADAIEGILNTATEIGASVIVFQPRPDGRALEPLSRDGTLELMSSAECPVLALPASYLRDR